MFGLMVTGRSRCIVAALVGLDNMIFYQLDRDEETIAAMRAEAVRFWHEHVLARVPPDPQTMRDMKLIMDRIGGRPAALNADMVEKIAQLQEARATAKALTEHGGTIEQLEFDIGAYVLNAWGYPSDAGGLATTDNAILTFEGRKVATWNRQRGAHLDQKRLKLERPEIIEQYTQEHFYRVLRFPKPKGA
jgi:predicted phage-related endonuclease